MSLAPLCLPCHLQTPSRTCLKPVPEVGEHARPGRGWPRLAASSLRATLTRTFGTFSCARCFPRGRGKLRPGRARSLSISEFGLKHLDAPGKNLTAAGDRIKVVPLAGAEMHRLCWTETQSTRRENLCQNGSWKQKTAKASKKTGCKTSRPLSDRLQHLNTRQATHTPGLNVVNFAPRTPRPKSLPWFSRAAPGSSPAGAG